MNIDRTKRFLVFFLSVAMVFTMMPTTVFAGGGGGSRDRSFNGSSTVAETQPIVYVYWDDVNPNHYDPRSSENPANPPHPVQGGFQGNSSSNGRYLKAQNGDSTIQWWIDKIQWKLRQRGGRYSSDKYNRKLGTGKTREKEFKAAAEDALIRANKRHPVDPKTSVSRIIGVAVTLLHDDDSHSWYFGGHSASDNWAKFKNMFPRAPKKSDMANDATHDYWKVKDKRPGINKTLTWYDYIYEIGYKDCGDRNISNGCRFIVLAMNDYEPVDNPPEFDTELVDLAKTGDGVKWDASEPGNVKVQDEILYKNVPEKGYKVTAKLKVSDDVVLVQEPEVEPPDPPDWSDEGIDGSETYVSEDSVVSVDGKTVSIDDEAEAYSTYNTPDAKFWALVFKTVNGEIDYDHPTVTELNNPGETDVALEENDVMTVVYSVEEPDADTEGVLIKITYHAAQAQDDTPTFDPDDDTSNIEAEGLIVGEVKKATPTPDFKIATDVQKDWQHGSIITFGGANGERYIDLYKLGLYNDVSDFAKVYKAGVMAWVHSPAGSNEKDIELNLKLKQATEATAIKCEYGTLTFDKQAIYNFKSSSVVETGAKFDVYSKEFASYDAAVADAQAKGYETYKYDRIVIDNKQHDHGEGLVDYIDWQLHNGMLVPGTYVIKETSAGDFSKSNQLIEPFEIVVKAREIGTTNTKLDNPHYKYKLTVEKRSTNFWREGWEPWTEDPLFSEQTKFTLESLDDEKNAMGNGDNALPTAKNSDGSLLSSQGYISVNTTSPWTIEIDNLPSGRYRLTEDAPIGYWLPEDKASVEFKVYRDMNGGVVVDSLKGHDAAFTKDPATGEERVDIRKTETTDTTSYAVTFTRSNVHQKTWLKLHKDRDAENILGNTESEGFPYVEFNLYSVGDIRSYDGHKDHVYYTDGQLIRGITIDEETGKRHYYNDGKEVSEETFRIMTDLEGDWDSGKIWQPANRSLKGEGLVDGGANAWKWYPLTNNNLIDTYDSNGKATGEKDGVSKYKFQEMYIWEFGDHISFNDSQKSRLAAQWTENYTKEGTVYGSMDEKIPDIGLSMNQILNHGIDITENDSQDSAMTGDKTYTYSSFGIQLDNDDVVMAFLRDKVLQYVDPANGVDDTTETIMNNRQKDVGTIEYNLLVLWPDQKTQFPKIDETNSEFQVLPDNIDTTEVIESVRQMFTNEDVPQLKTVAEVNEPGNHVYESNAEKVTIHDTVSYYNLKQGREYEMIGTLYNIEDNGEVDENGNAVWSLGEPILDDKGEPLTVVERFIPKNKKGKVEMVFDVTPRQLNYDNVVVYERCELAGDLIAEEADPSIESQRITTGLAPVIETQATYAGKHIMPNDSDVTFIDTVEYWGLTKGTEYMLKGELRDKETGEIVKVGDKEITTEYKFTATARHDFAYVPFELNTSDLDGKSVVVFEELCDANGNSFDPRIEHKDIEDENQTISVPTVETNASDEATEEHVAELNKKEVVVDVVKYTGLIPGEKYTVKGQLMKKPDGSVEQVVEATDETPAPEGEQPAENAEQTQVEQQQPVLEVRAVGDDANAEATNDEAAAPDASAEPYEVLAEAEKSFTADEADGSIELKFTVDATKLHGHSAVAFETIYDDETGLEIAIHRDINDRDQTIDYPEIETTALDGNIKLHVGEFGTTVTIIDTVDYKNVTPGLEYELTGTLMDKATGDPLKIDGKVVKASKKFTPETADGAEDLTFELDSTKLGGTSAVAFEELTYNDVLVAEHKDIEDDEQTVDYPEIKTIAVDSKTKTHEGLASADAQIIDTVQYKNLTPGVEYIVRGVLMDKETGDVYIAGKGDTAGVANSTAKTASDAAAAIAGAVKEPKAEAQKEAPQTEVAQDQPKADEPKAEEPKAEGEGEAVTPAVDEQKDDAQKEDADTAKTDGAKEEAAAPAEVKKDAAVSATPTPGAVWAEVKFTPTEKDGEIEIPFDIKNGDVAGKTLVAFESIYVLNENGEEVEVGRHEDITDPDQTVGYPEIRTNAVDAESGEHVGLVRDSITVKDKVTYKGLTPGQTYTVVGTLMDKETGKPIVAGADAKKMKDKTSDSGKSDLGNADLSIDGMKEVVAGKDIDAGYYKLTGNCKDNSFAYWAIFFSPDGSVPSERDSNHCVGNGNLKNGESTIIRLENNMVLQYATGKDNNITYEKTSEVPVDSLDLALQTFFNMHWVDGKYKSSEEILSDTKAEQDAKKAEADAKADAAKADEAKPSETKEVTPAEKAAEGAQASGAVTAQKTFTAESSEGSVEIEFTFTGVDMSNRAAVAFEKLYAGGKVDDNMVVATHEDINDPDQTVFYPTIDTKASYKDGVITDTVTYTNLIPGLEYELTGTLMDKKSGNSMEISAMTKFTPKEANGTVDMKFEVDKDKIAGKSIVVFETLKLNGKVVAEHHDINDKDQTVTIDKKNPSKETKESKDAKKDKKDSTDRASYKTGDFLPYILMAVLAMILASIYVVQRRRRREEE